MLLQQTESLVWLVRAILVLAVISLIRILVYGYEGNSGSEDLVSALLQEPFASEASTQAILNRRKSGESNLTIRYETRSLPLLHDLTPAVKGQNPHRPTLLRNLTFCNPRGFNSSNFRSNCMKYHIPKQDFNLHCNSSLQTFPS